MALSDAINDYIQFQLGKKAKPNMDVLKVSSVPNNDFR